jgi:hypothetical protein
MFLLLSHTGYEIAVQKKILFLACFLNVQDVFIYTWRHDVLSRMNLGSIEVKYMLLG